MEDKIIMLDRKSNCSSDFAVFEHFRSWKNLRESLVLPNGVYFAVLVSLEKFRFQIEPNLFIQGYQPHSSGKNVVCSQRGYGAFIQDESLRRSEDDLLFFSSQLYQIKEKTIVELILCEGESQDLQKTKWLAQRICNERSYQQLGDLARYNYFCRSSAGYFLAGRNYQVWAMLIGESTGFSLKKRMLVIDFLTGIPSIVDYVDDNFILI